MSVSSEQSKVILRTGLCTAVGLFVLAALATGADAVNKSSAEGKSTVTHLVEKDWIPINGVEPVLNFPGVHPEKYKFAIPLGSRCVLPMVADVSYDNYFSLTPKQINNYEFTVSGHTYDVVNTQDMAQRYSAVLQRAGLDGKHCN